ncbi:hypothetical protein LEP1GSC133_3337 [Leptospira borgpetersenii serovar Pomona str. 200901868]|uniref:Uncharacterized protein n=2 Tax=Leptospira borgpetersenii TaxID=174 RepID=M3HHN1_LEPBO|nr:hypothetical protein LEP1GSC123_1227 [Leptospira borgpetersenii str. 200701203]EMO61374.1 hypothetical protein LEP1GSC133_3337 [Leptospira borgpetersenii serovar Pomona str. 200901868]
MDNFWLKFANNNLGQIGSKEKISGFESQGHPVPEKRP